MNNYVPYHLHTSFSNSMTPDSTSHYQDYIDLCIKYGIKAISFSEHGSSFEWIKKKQACDEAGVRYLHGAECYLTTTLEEKLKETYHIGLYAKNWEGVKELNKLTSNAFKKEDNHFYYKPRISMEELMNTSDNIIVTTACLGSIFWQRKDDESVIEPLLEWVKNNNHRVFLEIQYHDHHEQREYNQLLLRWSKETGAKLIAGTDTHSASSYDAECRQILQKAKNMSYGDEDTFDLTFKTYDELVEAFDKQNSLPKHVYMEAIENTNYFASLIEDFELDTSFKYPNLYEDDEQKYKNMVRDKYKEKVDKGIIDDSDGEYKKRIKEETEAFDNLEMYSFMAFMSEMSQWSEDNNIPKGFSRGSVAGSTVAYILDITDVDPVKWNTVFSRFVNKDRISLGDIDIDYDPRQRDYVYDYIVNRFPKNHTSYIITYNTVSDKGTIDEIGRALKVPLQKVDIIKKDYEKNPEKTRKENPDMFYYFDGLKDTIISKGMHPAGMIASPISLNDNIGFIYEDGKPISQCGMKAVDSLNYVKFDILGLKNIAIISDTFKYLNMDYMKSYEIDWNDQNVWEDMIKSPVGLFQFEGNFAFSMLKEFKPKRINDMSIVNAALRPSGESYRDKLMQKEFHENPSEEIDELLKDNLGYLIFQEDTIKFLTDICGLSGAEADNIRRCVDENTLVTMGSGNVKKIKDVKVGEEVLSMNEHGVVEPKVVKNVFQNGRKDVYRVKTVHGKEINATEDHEVFTQDGYKMIKDIGENDFIMSAKKYNSISDDLKPSKRLSSKDMMLLGLLIGDGTINEYSKSGEKRYQPCFTNSDTDLIDAYKECVVNRLRSKKNTPFNDDWFSVHKQKGKNVDWVYQIYIKDKPLNKSVINLLDKYNLRSLSKDKIIPESIMMYPKGDKILNLLGGLFSTDGGCYKNYIDYSTNSYLLANQIKNILLKFGIYSYVDTRTVRNYEYESYRVRISQPYSLQRFKENILPFVLGLKYEKYLEVIDNVVANKSTYNYQLPNKCKKEVREGMTNYNKSYDSIGSILGFDTGAFNVHQNEFGISDRKAEMISREVYMPYTYKLLMSEYIPLRVKSIEYAGEGNVYDIEVKDNHNYLANDLLVHNCIGKKDEEGLKGWLPKILEGYCEMSDKPRGVAEEEAKEFIQVIKDSSDYQFGMNHSTGYSMVGYLCAYLRYYYPLEFIAAFLNNAKNEEDIINGTSLAEQKGVNIKPPRFGYSLGNYTIDYNDRSVYKGIATIKYLNYQIAEDLMSISENEYKTFTELLIDIIEKTSVNSRQLDILIKLNFFERFGDVERLVAIYDNFVNGDSKYKKTYVQKTKDKRIPALIEWEETTECKASFPISEQLIFQKEHLGYVDTKLDVPKSDCIVVDANLTYTPRLTFYQLATGKELTAKIKKKTFFQNGEMCALGDRVRINKTFKDYKWKKTEKGFEQDKNQQELFVSSLTVIDD